MKDEDLIERVARATEAPPMTPSRAARFDEQLHARRTRRPLAWLWLAPALATAAAAAWFTLGTHALSDGPAPSSEPAPMPALASAEAEAEAEPANDIDLTTDSLFAEATDTEFGALPADYEMLASLTERALGWAPGDNPEEWEIE